MTIHCYKHETAAPLVEPPPSLTGAPPPFVGGTGTGTPFGALPAAPAAASIMSGAPGIGRAQCAVSFRWSEATVSNSSSFEFGKVTKFSSISDDIGSLLLAVAIWCMRRSASLQFSSDGDDVATKEAFSCLKRAAGIFDYMKEQRSRAVAHAPDTDFDVRIIEALSLQCLAEANEITLERARQKKHAPELIASIARDTELKYAQTEVLTKQLAGNTLPAYKKYLTFKRTFYKAYTLCFQGTLTPITSPFFTWY